jgi:hypothetical protein
VTEDIVNRDCHLDNSADKLQDVTVIDLNMIEHSVVEAHLISYQNLHLTN